MCFDMLFYMRFITTTRGGARAVTASDMSLPIIFWTIPEIRQNPMRKNRGGGGMPNCVNIWVL